METKIPLLQENGGPEYHGSFSELAGQPKNLVIRRDPCHNAGCVLIGDARVSGAELIAAVQAILNTEPHL